MSDTTKSECGWFHEWSRWEDKQRYNIKLVEKITGQVIVQERRCLKCNKVKLRYEELQIV